MVSARNFIFGIGPRLKIVFKMCKIDEHFTGHSTRHASTSKAYKKGLKVFATRVLFTLGETRTFRADGTT